MKHLSSSFLRIMFKTLLWEHSKVHVCTQYFIRSIKIEQWCYFHSNLKIVVVVVAEYPRHPSLNPAGLEKMRMKPELDRIFNAWLICQISLFLFKNPFMKSSLPFKEIIYRNLGVLSVDPSAILWKWSASACPRTHTSQSTRKSSTSTGLETILRRMTTKKFWSWPAQLRLKLLCFCFL